MTNDHVVGPTTHTLNIEVRTPDDSKNSAQRGAKTEAKYHWTRIGPGNRSPTAPNVVVVVVGVRVLIVIRFSNS